MEIKRKLKNLDIKISKIANDLGLSRPTLDSYIQNFDNGQSIPNEGYQKIFEYLFLGYEISSVEFAQRFDYVKRVMLTNSKKSVERNLIDEKYETGLSNIKDILETKTLEKPLIEFINVFIKNKDKDLVKAIYMYFNFTNGFQNLFDYDILEKDKALFSQLSKLFNDYNNNNIILIQDNYNQIIEKNKKMFDKNQVIVNDKDIVEYIKNNLENEGNLDLVVLKELIKLREGN